MRSCGLADFANDAPVKNQMVGEKRLYRSRAYYWRKCKTERGKTNIDSLPDELLLDILARLPADDLHYRARLVCRRWRHLIHSDCFIKTQLHCSTYGLFLSNRRSLDHPIFVTATQGRIETSVMPYRVPMSSCCNGLAVQFQEMPMSIINPVTRQQFLLPSFPSSEYKMVPSECVIGYAADSMEYKVVLPCRKTDGDRDGDRVFLGILSVGSDKSWRHVGVEHLSAGARSLLENALGMARTSEGFITWSNKIGIYFTLDVETEILTEHPSPLPDACVFKPYHFYLSTGRTLSLLVFDMSTRYLVQLWEMKAETGEWRKLVDDIKLGAHARWLERFSPRSGPCFLKPLGWVRYPEVLALNFLFSCDCIFFNLNTQEISSMELPERCEFYSSLVHKKSLTWIR